MLWHSCRTLLAAACFAVTLPAIAANSTFGPIPAYTSHVTTTDHMGATSAVIKTTDGVDQVAAWYRKSLPHGTTEHTGPDGNHIFILPGGTNVDVEPGNAFDKQTTIGMTWH